MVKEIRGTLSARGRTFALIAPRFNDFITRRLVEGAIDCLVRHGAEEKDMSVFWLPGSFEIPSMAMKLATSGRYDAVICLGAVIRGDTPHFDYVASEVAKGVAQVGLTTGVPTIFGVVTADTTDQAIERAGAKEGNKGWDAAMSAMEMVDLYGSLPGKRRTRR
ncbi:6,7-dimethyl-8-ribityllumazine synthase [candidate division TA06 bacterium DG_24]|jgi:6,7-dimethyl-8-ribityllumazine synthase|uniref:6,7-dimethyl-8-ribityllumazine synthase n=2 Tax=Bacteria division TA06 TaxID=1156500 RepID=A0A0S8G517_UNCT6|nr:MAG: 6,7-dimethyl-8-ribityllumazine synthase [candidate division TA06 bacterium DG_24]KPK67904.1 MAG: 6,7-dimethyl-8-ribityllumazine synthase [candidate division TA06 bacterium SM23_40]